MKKYLIFILIIFNLLLCQVHATSFKTSAYVGNMYIKKEKGSINRYLQSEVIVDDQTNKPVYCLEPFINFNPKINYQGTTNKPWLATHLSEEQFRRVEAYAYFGYNYTGRTALRFYSITQLLIWRTIDKEANIYFTSTLNGSLTHAYDADIKEVEDAVNNYLNLHPSYNRKLYNVNLNDKININSEGYILNDNQIDISSSNNTFTINGNSPGYHTYYTHSNNLNNPSTIYVDSTYQDLLAVGNDLMPKDASFQVYVPAGRIKINFHHDYQYPSTCLNKTSNYGLYNFQDILVKEYNIDSSKADELYPMPTGQYYIKQISNGCDTLKDNTKYDFNLEAVSTIDISLKENTKDITFTKVYGSKGNYLPEKDSQFFLTDGQNNYNLITNDLGVATITLGIGKYNFHQLTGKTNYTFSSDLSFDLSHYDSSSLSFSLYDEAILSSISVIVKDDKSNLLPKEKICLYENEQQITCQNTNQEGLINFNDLILKNYTLKYLDDVTKINLSKDPAEVIFIKPPSLKEEPIIKDESIIKEANNSNNLSSTIILPDTLSLSNPLIIFNIFFVGIYEIKKHFFSHHHKSNNL